ncbi:MAG: magnesium transporter [Dehalococcoidia bacterium]|nr:magnesium transporter [Dehalococcoidia bacterium]
MTSEGSTQEQEIEALAVPSPLEQVKDLLEEEQGEEAARIVGGLREADAAALLAALGKSARVEIVRRTPAVFAGQVLNHLDRDDAVTLGRDMGAQELAAILDHASPDVSADVIHGLSKEAAYGVIAAMAHAERVTPLLSYGDDTAGGLMVPETVSLREWMTADEALAALRESRQAEYRSRLLFVLDRGRLLVGIVDLWRLVQAPPRAVVRDLMDADVVTVRAETDQEECARVMARYNLLQLPVVDAQRRVLGVILAEDIIDVVQEEATEDILRLLRIGPMGRLLSPLRRPMLVRVPWLAINLGTVFLAASVINIFESTIAKAAVIAVFLPMVASQGGVAGMQTLALVTRGITLGEVRRKEARRVLLKEAGMGAVNGAVTGALAGGAALLWKDDWKLGLVVGVAMILNLITAGIFGALIPIMLRAARLDPALGSAVVLTTVTDIAGFGIVLLLASLYLV